MRRQTLKYNPWIIIGLAFLFVALLLVGFHLRTIDSNLVLSGLESYTHLQAIDSGAQLSLYEQVLSAVLSLGSFSLVTILFLIFLALSSFVLFTLVIIRHSKKASELYYSLGILVISIPAVYLFLGLTQLSFVLVLSLFALYANLKSESTKNIHLRQLFYILQILFIGVIFAQNYFIGLFSALFLLLHKLLNKTSKDFFTTFIFIALEFILVWFLPLAHTSLLAGFHPFKFDASFSFFGTGIGYTLFVFILGLGGTLITNRVPLSTSKIFLFSILILSLFNQQFLVFGVFIMSFYAATAFVVLVEKEWLISFLRLLTIIIFVCMVLFSSITLLKQIPFQTPTSYQVHALDKVNSIQNSRNLSCGLISDSLDQSYIGAFTKSDPGLFDVNQKDIFDSQDYSQLQEIFASKNICFIHFDDTKKSFFQLQRPPKGLDFIIKYSDSFDLVYSLQGQRVYYYRGLEN